MSWAALLLAAALIAGADPARVRIRAGLLTPAARAVRAARAALLSSVLAPGGAAYTPLAKIPLAEAA